MYMLNPIPYQHLSLQQAEALWANSVEQKQELFVQIVHSDLSDILLCEFIHDHQEEVKAFGDDISISQALSDRTAGIAQTVDTFSVIINPLMTSTSQKLMKIYSNQMAESLQKNNFGKVKQILKNLITNERINEIYLYCFIKLNPLDEILEMQEIQTIFEEVRREPLNAFLNRMHKEDANRIDFSPYEETWGQLNAESQLRFIEKCLSFLSPETYKQLALFLVRHGFTGMDTYSRVNTGMVEHYAQMLGIGSLEIGDVNLLDMHIKSYRETV